MDFKSQGGVDGIDERSNAFFWQSSGADAYPNAIKVENQHNQNQFVMPSFSGNEEQLNWQQLQGFPSSTEYESLEVNLQSPFNPSNASLIQSSASVQDRRSSAGFLSDHGFPDLSNHASPACLDDQLEEQLGPRLVLDDNNDLAGPGAHRHSSISSQMRFNSPHNGSYRGNTQLLSPVLTGTSSPASGIAEPSYAATVPLSHAAAGLVARPTNLSPQPAEMPQHLFENSQAYNSVPNLNTTVEQATRLDEGRAHTTSPYSAHKYADVLSNEMYRQASSATSAAPITSEAQPNLTVSLMSQDHTRHKRSFTTSEPDQEFGTHAVERLDDGSWRPNESTGQSGLAPDYRDKASANVPTLEEQEKQRILDEHNADVEEWLSRNETGKPAREGRPQLTIPNKQNVAHRRAKSTGAPFNEREHDHFDDSHIPGPGLNIQEQSDIEEGADESSFDAEGDESPPARVDASLQEQRSRSPSSHPEQGSSRSRHVQPWYDEPKEQTCSDERYQPATSNAAMMKFYHRARDLETASRSATLGSRRRSDTDLESLFSQTLGNSQTKQGKPTAKSKPDFEKSGNFFANFKARRPSANILKRKGTSLANTSQNQSQFESHHQVNDARLYAPTIHVNNRRPRSPRIDTQFRGNRSPREPSSAVSSTSLTPWNQAMNQAKNAILRSRSKSDLGLKDLITQHGGPPMLKLASSKNDAEQLEVSVSPEQEDEELDINQENELAQPNSIAMDMKVRYERIVPTVAGFKKHVLEINPRLAPFLADRIAGEQYKRYRKLLDAQTEHRKAVDDGPCPSGDLCPDLGGSSRLLPLRTNNKNSATATLGFQVVTSPVSEDDGNNASQNDGVIVPAQFPSGIPIPPVSRLPAEFECPLCFKVKQFIKPSDWTKHVHEDVSPFTCTFESCVETKSFKRKADWVRHENERHRRLESWNCNFTDCAHSCHRKDNFVQHLVREHGLPEPKIRTTKSVSGPVTAGPIDIMGVKYEDIWKFIDACKQDTSKSAEDEPCRFCGNTCGSWKKLTVHLAKHLEQISLPVLGLLLQSRGVPRRAPTTGPPAAQLFDSLQQIDYRQPFSNIPAQNWMGEGMSTTINNIPLHVNTRPQIDVAAQASFSTNTYPPVQLHNHVTNESQNFLQGQSAVYSNHGLDTAATQQYPPQQFPARFSNQPSNTLSGGFPITDTSGGGSRQQSFVSSPVESAGYGSGAFTGHHIHSSTYPGS